jgi:hypothetical protein
MRRRFRTLWLGSALESRFDHLRRFDDLWRGYWLRRRLGLGGAKLVDVWRFIQCGVWGANRVELRLDQAVKLRLPQMTEAAIQPRQNPCLLPGWRRWVGCWRFRTCQRR